MRRHFIGIIIIFCIISGLGYTILNSTLVLSYYIPRFAEKNITNIKIENFSFDRQSFVFPDTLYLYGVDLKVFHQEAAYEISIKEVKLPDIKKLWKEKHQLKIFAKSADISSQSNFLQNVDFKTLISIHNGAVVGFDGIFEGQKLSFAQYDLGYFSARVKSDSQQLELYEIDADGYGGTIAGQVQISFDDAYSYIVWMEFSDFQTTQLSKIYDELFGDMDSILNGNLRAIGNVRKLDLLDVNFSTVKGGTLKKAKLDKVLNHLVDPRKKDVIRSIIHNETTLFVDEGALHIRNASENVATITFSFENTNREIYIMENVGHSVVDGFPRLLVNFPEND